MRMPNELIFSIKSSNIKDTQQIYTTTSILNKRSQGFDLTKRQRARRNEGKRDKKKGQCASFSSTGPSSPPLL